MATLVTIAQADAHLRLDLDQSGSPPSYDDDRLPDLELKLDAAEAIILDYLKVDREVLDGSPPNYATSSPVLWTQRELKVISASILLLLSALWDDAPDRTVADYMKHGGTVPLLLARLRDPTLA